MEKEKLIVFKTEEEESENGILIIKVTLKKGDALYNRAAKASDLLDLKKKKSIYKHWKHSIEEIEQAQARPEKDKKAMKADIEAMEGEEISDE